MYILPEGGYAPGTKASLIGILWGVVEKNTMGSLMMGKIPASTEASLLVKTSLNLGVAMHAAHLLEIEDIIRGVKGTS